MHENFFGLFLSLSFAAILAAIVCSILSARESNSPRKGRLRFAATLLFASTFCLSGIEVALWLRSLPTLTAEGVIQSATVHSRGRGYRTDFTVAGAEGTIYHLNADGRSDYFRPDEHVVLTYRGYTGSVIKVHFITQSGAEEGVFQSTESLQPFVALAIGCFLGWAGYRKFRRDPEDSE